MIFPDLNQSRIPTNYAQAGASGIVAFRGRGGLGIDTQAKTFHAKFSAQGIVEIIYSSEGSVDAYKNLTKDFPWEPGILYAADVERGGMSTAEAKIFCTNPHAVFGYRNPSGPAFGAKYDWLAEYGPKPSGADIWQFTDGVVGPEPHTFPGVGSCDINQFFMDLDTLRIEAGLEVADTVDQKFSDWHTGLRMRQWHQLTLEWEAAGSDPAKKPAFDYQAPPFPVGGTGVTPTQEDEYLGWDFMDRFLKGGGSVVFPDYTPKGA